MPGEEGALRPRQVLQPLFPCGVCSVARASPSAGWFDGGAAALGVSEGDCRAERAVGPSGAQSEPGMANWHLRCVTICCRMPTESGSIQTSPRGKGYNAKYLPTEHVRCTPMRAQFVLRGAVAHCLGLVGAQLRDRPRAAFGPVAGWLHVGVTPFNPAGLAAVPAPTGSPAARGGCARLQVRQG